MLPPTLVFIIVIALQAFYAAANIDDKLIIYSIYRDLDTFGELYVAPRVDSNYGYQLDKETFSDMIDKIKNTHPDKLECSTFGFPPGLCLALTKGGAFLKKSGWILVRGWLLEYFDNAVCQNHKTYSVCHAFDDKGLCVLWVCYNPQYSGESSDTRNFGRDCKEAGKQVKIDEPFKDSSLTFRCV